MEELQSTIRVSYLLINNNIFVNNKEDSKSISIILKVRQNSFLFLTTNVVSAVHCILSYSGTTAKSQVMKLRIEIF